MRIEAGIAALGLTICFAGLAVVAEPQSTGSPLRVFDETGPPGSWVIRVVIDPYRGTVFAGLHGGGFVKKEAEAETWTASNDGLEERTVIPIAFDPTDSRTMYAGTELGIYKTTDGGATWSEASRGLTNENVWALSVDPGRPQDVYAGTAGGGLFKSTDGGGVWAESNNGLGSPLVSSLILVAGEETALYAGTLTDGVFKSTDGARRWIPVGSPTRGRRILALLADPKDPARLYAGTGRGILASGDGGNTWTEIGLPTGKELVFALAVDPRDSATLYAGTGAGVLASDDGGATWRELTSSIGDPIVWTIAVDPRDSDRLYAGTLGRGLFTSGDRGRSWSDALPPLNHQLVYALVARGSPKRLYAGTAGAGVYRSKDDGLTWTAVNRGLPNLVVKALVGVPGDENVLYAAAQHQFMGGAGGIFKTTTGGETWVRVSAETFDEHVFSLLVDPKASQAVYAGTEEGHVFRSTDAGASWSTATIEYAGSTASAIQTAMHGSPVFSLAMDPRDSGVLYAGTGGGGVFKSSDRGTTWKNVNEGLTDLRIRAVLVDPKDPDVVYAGTGDFGAGALFRSRDAGGTWERTSLRDQWVLALAADSDRDTIYAGTELGVFRSRSKGASWEALAVGEKWRYVLSLAIAPGPRRAIFAGTEGHGVFSLTEDDSMN